MALFRSWVSLADGLFTPLRCLATTAQVNPLNGDPSGLTELDISKIYSVPNKEVRELYPRGLPKSFTTLAETFRETSWLLRPRMFDIMCQLSNNESPHSKKKYLIFELDGGDGCGKSLFIGQLVHWCWKAGWMVIHVPGVSFWAHSRKELRPSTLAADMYDQPQEASTWLSNFKKTNANILKSMSLSETKNWSRRESSEQGDPLVKVIELGLHKPVLATDIVGVVLQEVIKEHNRRSASDSPEVEKFKMVLTIDEFNSCYNPCSACISKFESIETRQLNLIKYFRDLTPVDKGMKDVVGYEHIEVDNLSQIEVNALLQYFKSKMWITKEPFDEVCKEVWHLSEGNAAEVFKLSNSL